MVATTRRAPQPASLAPSPPAAPWCRHRDFLASSPPVLYGWVAQSRQDEGGDEPPERHLPSLWSCTTSGDTLSLPFPSLCPTVLCGAFPSPGQLLYVPGGGHQSSKRGPRRLRRPGAACSRSHSCRRRRKRSRARVRATPRPWGSRCRTSYWDAAGRRGDNAASGQSSDNPPPRGWGSPPALSFVRPSVRPIPPLQAPWHSPSSSAMAARAGPEAETQTASRTRLPLR